MKPRFEKVELFNQLVNSRKKKIKASFNKNGLFIFIMMQKDVFDSRVSGMFFIGPFDAPKYD